MAKAQTSRGRKQDRAKVAGGQKYEVRYEAKKTGRSAAAVKKTVKKVGNSRKKVERRLEGDKCLVALALVVGRERQPRERRKSGPHQLRCYLSRSSVKSAATTAAIERNPAAVPSSRSMLMSPTKWLSCSSESKPM